ncbi:hypothetical protein LQF60_02885 [Tetragenococcus koreensis]|uniref:hypothetical protein n=1 Tax=Tetragenococcus koreensis TaxID=290335 RepID=UPI001F202C14|nr:hypothetical protein [Tetragenococcus koreensis]MCF1585241.1 hypothetical protein [Tetragenococcus koreensis]MCF1628783.1 hypothetical protein [Tetragenococcus koreensis]
MTKADIVQLQENGEPKYVATHANAVEGLSDFIQKDYDKLGNTEKIYVSGGRGDNSLADGSENRPYRTIQAAVDSLPMISGTEFYIFIEAGVYLEDVTVSGVRSARLEIISTKNDEENAKEANTSVMVRSITFEDCGMYCRAQGITQTDPQSTYRTSFIKFVRTNYGAINNCRAVINTKSFEEYNAFCFDGSTGGVYVSIASNQKTAVAAKFCSQIRATPSLVGTGNETAFHSHASSLYETSNVEGSTSGKKSEGGQIFS